MNKEKNKMLFGLVLLLTVYVLFTLLQIYYSAYIHLILFFLCICATKKIDKDIIHICLIGGITFVIFSLISAIHGESVKASWFFLALYFVAYNIIFCYEVFHKGAIVVFFTCHRNIAYSWECFIVKGIVGR